MKPLVSKLRQGFDVDKDRVYMDLLEPFGVIKAISLVLRLQEQGLLFAGLPCCSFIFISAGTHKRTTGSPWGQERWKFVRDGNVLGSRFTLLACLAVARAAVWLVENPSSTVLFWLPPLKWLLQKGGMSNQAVRWQGPHLLSAAIATLGGSWYLVVQL